MKTQTKKCSGSVTKTEVEEVLFTVRMTPSVSYREHGQRDGEEERLQFRVSFFISKIYSLKDRKRLCFIRRKHLHQLKVSTAETSRHQQVFILRTISVKTGLFAQSGNFLRLNILPSLKIQMICCDVVQLHVRLQVQ